MDEDDDRAGTFIRSDVQSRPAKRGLPPLAEPGAHPFDDSHTRDYRRTTDR